MKRYTLPSKKTTPNPYLKEAVGIFHEWYKANFYLEYQWEPKDFANLKLILRKIKNQNPEGNSLEDFEAILNSLKGSSPWHYKNATVPIINSGYNVIIANATQAQRAAQYFKDFEWETPGYTRAEPKPKPQKTPEELAKIRQEEAAIRAAYEKLKAQVKK